MRAHWVSAVHIAQFSGSIDGDARRRPVNRRRRHWNVDGAWLPSELKAAEALMKTEKGQSLHALPTLDDLLGLYPFPEDSRVGERLPRDDIEAVGAYLCWVHAHGGADGLGDAEPADYIRRGRELLSANAYKPHFLETELQVYIENDFSDLVGRLRAGNETENDRDRLRAFPFLFLARGPELVERMRQWAGSGIENFDLDHCRDPVWQKVLATPQNFELVAFDKVLASETAHAAILHTVVSNPHRYRWPATLWRSRGRRFVIGDRPAIAWRKGRPHLQGQLNTIAVHLVIPLAPDLALHFGFQGGADPAGRFGFDKLGSEDPVEVRDVTDEQVDEVNRAQVHHALEVVVALDDADFPPTMRVEPPGARASSVPASGAE